MIRRQFLRQAAAVGAAGLAAVETGCSRERRTMVFAVEGFTCVTCATGLETLLGRERGVLSVVASYAQKKATVIFDPSRITGDAIAVAIREMGFVPAVQTAKAGHATSR